MGGCYSLAVSRLVDDRVAEGIKDEDSPTYTRREMRAARASTFRVIDLPDVRHLVRVQIPHLIVANHVMHSAVKFCKRGENNLERLSD